MPYLTPDDLPDADFVCRTLIIPNNLDIISVVIGALDELSDPKRWEKFGSVTPDEISAAMFKMVNDFIDEAPCP